MTDALVTTARLCLQPFAPADITLEYLGWLSDAEVVRFSNQRFRTHTQQSSEAYLASFTNSPNYFLSIRRREDDRAIGTMTAYVAEPHGTADMGLMIGDRACWGQGFGQEAWAALMAHLFAVRGLRKVTGGTVRPNVGMIRIMERSGMSLEAVRQRQEIIAGREEDVLYFARFRAG
jgi:[ribosomal protein S5]-alanine N-acetyltransferase